MQPLNELRYPVNQYLCVIILTCIPFADSTLVPTEMGSERPPAASRTTQLGQARCLQQSGRDLKLFLIKKQYIYIKKEPVEGGTLSSNISPPQLKIRALCSHYEAATLPKLLCSISEQTRPRCPILVCDQHRGSLPLHTDRRKLRENQEHLQKAHKQAVQFCSTLV